MSRCLMLLGSIAFLLAGAFSIEADEYYVSPSGSDDSPGTLARPWESIGYALFATQPGDTIFLRGGLHSAINDRTVEGNVGGTPGRPKVLMAYPGEVPIIGRDRGLRVQTSYLVIKGIKFENSYILVSTGFSNVQILDNDFSGDCGLGCINVHGNDHLIEGNRIDNVARTGTQDHGMYIHGGTNVIIRNNYINFFSEGYPIHVFEDQASIPHANITIEGNRIGGSVRRSGIMLSNPAASIDGVLIRNNLIEWNLQNGIRVRENVDNIEIYNNTFYNNGDSSNAVDAQGAISIRDRTDAMILIKNNIFHDNNVHVQNREDSPNVMLDNNLYWPSPANNLGITDANAWLADPLFVDAVNGNFQLTATSQAIDHGLDLGYPFIGAAPDLGAFEFGVPVPDISVTPERFDFGEVILNAATKQIIHVSNSGTGNLEVRMTVVTGSDFTDFSIISGAAPFTLMSAAGHDIVVEFGAASEGVKDAILQITSNDPDEPTLNVPLTGSVNLNTNVESTSGNISDFSLAQNYPNPFNPVTTIRFSLARKAEVKLMVFDIAGNEIAVVANGTFEQGEHAVPFVAENLSSGVYFYRLQAEGFTSTKKLILLK